MGGPLTPDGCTVPTVRVGEVDLYYETHGQGPLLVMINGLGSSVEMWGPFWKRLAEHHRVLLFDNRGVGRSTVPEDPFTIRTMADDAAGLMDALGISSAFVYGASMGGQIAQELTLGHPQKVRALVLGMTTCGGRHAILPAPETLTRLATLGDPPPGTSALEILWSLMYTPEYLTTHRAELEREATEVRHPTTPLGYRRQAEASLRFNVYDRLPEIRVPTLVLAGSRDALLPAGNAEIIAHRIPGAKLHIFEGAGHGFTRERPEESVQVILDFLSTVPERSAGPAAP